MTELPIDSRDARRWVTVAEAAADADRSSASDRGNVVPLGTPKTGTADIREHLERTTEAAAEAEDRAAAAEAEAEELRRRVRELESWIADSTRFEEVEQVQLGRLLAVASAEREARRLPLIASTRTLLLALYVLGVIAFIVLLVTRL
jgi:hypothetical protein